jgi:hypothetical protein
MSTEHCSNGGNEYLLHAQPEIRRERVKAVGYLIEDRLRRPVVVDLDATPDTVHRGVT